MVAVRLTWGPLPAKDIHPDLSNNFINKDAEGSLPVQESDQTLAAAVSPKESSGEDKEVCLTTKRDTV